MGRTSRIILTAALALGAGAGGCQREERPFRPAAPFARGVPYLEEYEPNAYTLAEGKRLFSSFNCVGCHAHGGGGMGPPLIDGDWIYGHEPGQVFTTIAEGRPNGMPAFGGKVVPYQIWQLVGYVRSLSGLVPKGAAPGRDDDMKANPPENSKDPETPVLVPPPSPTEAP